MTVTRTIAEQTCAANRESHTAGATTVPSGFSEVTVQLTSSQWSNPALAGKRVLWGIALSRDGGVTWGGAAGPAFADSTSNQIGGTSVNVAAWAYTTSIIGNLSRSGTPPYFKFTLDDLTAAQGCNYRLFAWPEIAIPLGAVLTAS